jgi:UDP-glucuronate 4-epimerase
LDELISELAEATGRQPRIERLPMPVGDVERTCADITRARELLGYDPTTGIREGVEAFVRWYREEAPAKAT